MSKETAIVTGGGGFVGSNVIEYFLKHSDLNLICIDSFNHKGDSMRLQKIGTYYKDRVRVFTHDLANEFSDRMIYAFGPIDYILNIASSSHVDRSISEPVPFVKNNVALALTMGELARKVSPKMFLQMSTDECFGPAMDGQRHKEWDTHKPSNPYSASKCAQDDILFSYWRCYGVPVVRTRTMNIFGPMQDPEKYIPMCIKRIFNEDKVTIHGTPNRVGSRMYLHVHNLADAWLWILNNIKPQVYQDIDNLDQRYSAFNITGLEEIDNLTLAKTIADIIGKPLNFEYVDFHAARPGHDRRYALDGTKLMQAGWSHPYSLEESLKQTIEWTLKNPEWLI